MLTDIAKRHVNVSIVDLIDFFSIAKHIMSICWLYW